MRSTTLALLVMAIVVLCCTFSAQSQSTVLDGIQLISSYFEPGTADPTDSSLTTDAMGMAYLRYQITLPTPAHQSYPLSVQVDLDALAVPGERYKDELLESITPGAVVSFHANPFFDGADLTAPKGHSSRQIVHHVLPFRTETTETFPATKSITPTLNIVGGMRRALDGLFGQQTWVEHGYDKQAHFIIVSIPLHKSLYSPIPTLPLGYAVTFGMEVPKPQDGTTTTETITRTLSGVISPNPASTPFPTDVTISSSSEDGGLRGTAFTIEGNWASVDGFEQTFGWATNPHAVAAMLANSTISGGEVYSKHLCRDIYFCHGSQLEKLSGYQIKMTAATPSTTTIAVTTPPLPAKRLDDGVYFWNGRDLQAFEPTEYAFDWRFYSTAFVPILNFDLAATATNKPFAVEAQHINERFPSYIRTEVLIGQSKGQDQPIEHNIHAASIIINAFVRNSSGSSELFLNGDPRANDSGFKDDFVFWFVLFWGVILLGAALIVSIVGFLCWKFLIKKNRHANLAVEADANNNTDLTGLDVGANGNNNNTHDNYGGYGSGSIIQGSRDLAGQYQQFDSAQ